MVTPSWSSFQNFKKSMVDNQIQEDIKEVPGGVADQIKPEGQKPEWGNFNTPMTYQGKKDPTADESNLGYFIRNASANAARFAERFAGGYGDLEKFAADTLVSIPEYGGAVGWAISQLVGKDNWEKFVRGNKNVQMFPTSNQLQDLTLQATGDYTKPKTPNEARLQETSGDFGSVLSGRIGFPNRFNPISTRRMLIAPAAANVTKKIAMDNGFGEETANKVKMLTWLPLTLSNSINAPEYASNLMNQGRQGIPQGLNVNTQRMLNRLRQIETDPNFLFSDPRSALARSQLDAIRRDIANGQTSVRSFMNAYDGVNAAKRNRGMFDLNRTDRNFARRQIDRVRDAVRDEIMESATNFPDALNSWQNGLQAWSVIHQSNAFKNFVENLATGPYAKILSGPALGLFGIGGYGLKQAPLVAGTLGAGAAGAYKAGQTLYRVNQSPVLSNYYWNALDAASRENAPTFISNYEKLNKALEENENKGKKSKKAKK